MKNDFDFLKDDFDFIKNKFDQSGVNAPDSLGKDFALDLIKNENQLKVIKKSNFTRNLAAAAVFAVFMLSAVVMTAVNSRVPAKSAVEGMSGLYRFNTRAAVSSAIDNAQKEEFSFEKEMNSDLLSDFSGDSRIVANKSDVSADASASAGASHNATYVQETGVDEADVCKTDGKYIFYQRETYDGASPIDVFTAEGKNSRRVAKILPKLHNGDSTSTLEFYLCDNRLIVIYNYLDDDSDYDGCYVHAEVFDYSDIKDIRLLDSFTQSGWYCSSRMIGSKLYLVTTHYADDKNDIPRFSRDRTATDDEATPDEVMAYNIYTVKKPQSTEFALVSEVDTADNSSDPKVKALLGAADDIYCTQDTLYVTSTSVTYNKQKVGTGIRYYYLAGINKTDTRILKINLKDDLKFTASGKVNGSVSNQYALDEKDGNLRVATTTKDKGKDTNNLFVLDKNLKKLGSVTGFAKDEHIEAVRYIGDTAYVITYEQTDPLFVIDLKKPTEPKILGSVKIDGFSTMLVPIDSKTLLGIGYSSHTEKDEYDDSTFTVNDGLKIVTFDISDKANPKVRDTKVYKNCSSAVQEDPKALVVNFERDDFTIPLNTDYYDEETDEFESGVLNFRVDNGKIKVIDRYVSEKFSDSPTNRCTFVGDTIYLFSDEAVYADDAKNTDNSDILDCVKYK